MNWPAPAHTLPQFVGNAFAHKSHDDNVWIKAKERETEEMSSPSSEWQRQWLRQEQLIRFTTWEYIHKHKTITILIRIKLKLNKISKQSIYECECFVAVFRENWFRNFNNVFSFSFRVSFAFNHYAPFHSIFFSFSLIFGKKSHFGQMEFQHFRLFHIICLSLPFTEWEWIQMCPRPLLLERNGQRIWCGAFSLRCLSHVCTWLKCISQRKRRCWWRRRRWIR